MTNCWFLDFFTRPGKFQTSLNQLKTLSDMARRASRSRFTNSLNLQFVIRPGNQIFFQFQVIPVFCAVKSPEHAEKVSQFFLYIIGIN